MLERIHAVLVGGLSKNFHNARFISDIALVCFPRDCRKSQALLEIMQAGAAVEAAIQRHEAEIDETMLELLKRRLEAARQLERHEDVLKGLGLLLRRLKAEVDRKAASPALKLLDVLLATMDMDSEAGTGAEVANASGTGENAIARAGDASSEQKLRDMRAEARKQVQARLQTAFGAVPLQVDVLSVASQIATAGPPAVDDIAQDHVDPETFMSEVTGLLEKAGEQQRLLEQALGQLGPDAPQRKQVEAVLSERAVTMSQVEEVLTMARAVQKRMGPRANL